jgi:hypothetical protein
MSIPTLAQLKRSINISEQIEKLQAELAAVFSGISDAISPAPAKRVPKKGKRKKGGISAAGRARIIAAQKARWAKVKSAAPVAEVATKPKRKKGKISAEGRANIIAAQKARWAKVKAAGKGKKK